MAKQATKFDPATQAWIDARKRHHLSHAHAQMARELGMNPKKLGKIDNPRQEPWKAPLPVFIEELYFRRFGKHRPDTILPIEELFRRNAEKKAAKRKAKLERKAATMASAAATDDEIMPPQGESSRS